MQTFLPYLSFSHSAAVLDWRRLGKQRLEVVQILRALAGETKGYRNHPATLMWEGHARCLVAYGLAICHEWILRGYRDSQTEVICHLGTKFPLGYEADRPSWLGNSRFHRAHKSNLVRKDPDFYGRIWPGMPDDLPYIWPVRKGSK